MKNHNKDTEKSRIRELASENRELKKMVAKLQRRINQLEAIYGDYGDVGFNKAQEKLSGKEKKEEVIDLEDPNRCPDCGKNNLTITPVPALGKILKMCKDCGFRVTEKVKEESK